MAYMNLLASVSESEVERLRNDPSSFVRPSMVSGASHLLSYWVKVEPLGGLLNRALDGGLPIHPELWHPLRNPRFHPADEVRDLADDILVAWDEVRHRDEWEDAAWLEAEMGRLTRVFCHASEAGECIISALDKPADEDRARRVRSLWTSMWDR